jgi:hypothetical protein
VPLTVSTIEVEQWSEIASSDTLRNCKDWEQNLEWRYSHMSPKPPVPGRPNLTDPRLEEQIRQRAYVLYEGRGGADGSALDDWLHAEEQVLALREAKTATSSS